MNKANNIINKFLLAGDKFTPGMHLRDPIVGTSISFASENENCGKFICAKW